jgi:hypothetical protein
MASNQKITPSAIVNTFYPRSYLFSAPFISAESRKSPQTESPHQGLLIAENSFVSEKLAIFIRHLFSIDSQDGGGPKGKR